jgi:uncharacterized DUF497 family protein
MDRASVSEAEGRWFDSSRAHQSASGTFSEDSLDAGCPSRQTTKPTVRFEWDPDKARRNLARHGLSFADAAAAFGDPLSLTISDPDHSDDEDRFLLLGMLSSGRLAVVVHVERAGATRIISARLATKRERRTYENG